jgi:hypothetical protein
MIRTALMTALTAAALASGACFEFSSTVTTPSGSAGAATQLVGGWASTSITAAQNSCTDFNWSVTQTSGNTAIGTFSATCFGNVSVSGKASGSLADAVLTWSATATAVVPGVTTCPIALSGTAQMVGDTITIPYSGTTCLGPVSGTETLKKPK